MSIKLLIKSILAQKSLGFFPQATKKLFAPFAFFLEHRHQQQQTIQALKCLSTVSVWSQACYLKKKEEKVEITHWEFDLAAFLPQVAEVPRNICLQPQMLSIHSIFLRKDDCYSGLWNSALWVQRGKKKKKNLIFTTNSHVVLFFYDAKPKAITVSPWETNTA